MSICERNIRAHYASPWLRGHRSRLARFERHWWARVRAKELPA